MCNCFFFSCSRFAKHDRFQLGAGGYFIKFVIWLGTLWQFNFVSGLKKYTGCSGGLLPCAVLRNGLQRHMYCCSYCNSSINEEHDIVIGRLAHAFLGAQDTRRPESSVRFMNDHVIVDYVSGTLKATYGTAFKIVRHHMCGHLESLFIQ